MSKYLFTVSQKFDLATHEVAFTLTTITVTHSTSGRIVYSKDFSKGIAFRCVGNDFQIGKLKADNYLKKSIDAFLPTAALWLEEKSNANQFIGSDDPSDESIYHIYNNNQCPVNVSCKLNIVLIQCPCDGSAQCTNKCYQYGR
jgi:hypothetical protein